MATSLSPSVVFLSCSLCHMFSYSPASFSNNGKCNKCSSFVALEARVSELEARLFRIQEPTQIEPPSGPPTEPTQLGSQADWVTVRRKQSSRPKWHHLPVHISNRFSPLSDPLSGENDEVTHPMRNRF